jgi:hypothetical protein
MNPKETLTKTIYESVYSEVLVGRSARAAGYYITTGLHHSYQLHTNLMHIQAQHGC